MPTWVYDLSTSVTFREAFFGVVQTDSEWFDNKGERRDHPARYSLRSKRAGIPAWPGAFRKAAYFSSTAEPQEACMHDADFVSRNPAPVESPAFCPTCCKKGMAPEIRNCPATDRHIQAQVGLVPVIMDVTRIRLAKH